MFEAGNVAEQFVGSLRTIIETVADRDVTHGSQLRRAAISAALNPAEGGRRTGRDRTHHFRIAAGSCAEAMSAVRIASALGWIDAADAAPAEALADRLRAMLWRLSNPRR